ncbi:malto-oligosyltrehalose trehalohydrolase [Pseudactinotalea sp. HY158]|uniref:malto-oligosyltrehalose trehalohydrolase n=1 Tax=Pseudactinotalea sp. HY158 TaxID=2654547 RepID=UPI00129CF1F8|nr:malto-oligosyltrehalose trehalohydrolase [Pseudactinotalea sp. HY158]QGH68307.1 malto-oligosyltrehalose trehalohydrolase [Pseudactinotalea sp. HY158]
MTEPTGIDLWAPRAAGVRLVTGTGGRLDHSTAQELTPAPGGRWHGPALPPGTDYAFLLGESEQPRPDPASRWQPAGVHGPSRVYDQGAYAWGDRDWRGAGLAGGVVYELHIGTFTPGATFAAAIRRLDHLVDLGITHVEVLPVNAFNGTWNWGYDGVGWYAVHEPYGGPDGFKAFVDACHGRGLAVVLDVVYNHFGPSGNYWGEFAPYTTTGRSTWGDLVNLADPNVREFICANALMWLRDFHVDGLRLDAVHALHDDSDVHILAELSERVDALAAEVGRPLTLIAESDLNDPIMITPRGEGGAPGGYGLAAQWDDDVHHALHSALTGERQGYYCDFGDLSVLAKVLTHAFLHDGTYSTFRGRDWGRPVDRDHVPGWRFVVCLQNHDQVGNRAVGDRLAELIGPDLLRVGAVLLLTSPFTPMLWMGQEWAASTRWPFFTSHPEPELARATGAGRLAEFDRHGWDTSAMIDPQDPAAYRSAVLDWAEAEPEAGEGAGGGDGAHAAMLACYRDLIALRAREPDLADGDLRAVEVAFDEAERWIRIRRGAFDVVANLGPAPRAVPLGAGAGCDLVFATAAGARGWVDGARAAVRLPPRSAAIVLRR